MGKISWLFVWRARMLAFVRKWIGKLQIRSALRWRSRTRVDFQMFDPAEYWDRRIDGSDELTSVGHRSFGHAYNRYVYERRLAMLEQWIRELGVRPSQLSVLDVGCGNGFYTGFWNKLGVKRYTGLDVSQRTIAELRVRFPEYRFICADVTDSSAGALPDKRFDVITLFDVMYHIVPDEKALSALRLLARHLAQDGSLFAFDQVARREVMLTPHVKFRSAHAHARIMSAAGLRIMRRRRLFSVLMPPVLGIRSLDLVLAATYKVFGWPTTLSRRIDRWIGAAMCRLDRRLLAFSDRIPNQEILLIKHAIEPGAVEH